MLKIVILSFLAFALINSSAYAQLTDTGSAWNDSTLLAVMVPASPEKGFNYPYLLKIPFSADELTSGYLLVETNNTGVTDSFEKQLKDTRTALWRGLSSTVANELSQPLLMPVFPRPESDWTVYTHALDRDTIEISEGSMARLDLQLLAMIDDAKNRLAASGFILEKKVVLIGFSASGTFANRFALIHPQNVAAVVAGGINAMPILPISTLNDIDLPYPLGISDFEELFDSRFDEQSWIEVKQFIFMGELDDNDAVQFDDGYSELERDIVYSVLGESMMPTRWENVQGIYNRSGADVKLITYPEIGHGTNRFINEQLIEFIRSVE